MDKTQTYISWTAIVSAAFIGVGVNFIFNLCSLAFSIASFSVGNQGQTTISLSGFSFFIFSAIISMFITGFVAGKLSPHYFIHKIWGAVIGFLAWSVLLILTIILLTNFIQYASFHTNFTSNLVAVKLMNNSPMLTETISHKIANAPLSFNIETTKKIITVNALLTFILFFLGACSSCLGGYLGYQSPPREKN